jgi:hypothetical protein
LVLETGNLDRVRCLHHATNCNIAAFRAGEADVWEEARMRRWNLAYYSGNLDFGTKKMHPADASPQLRKLVCIARQGQSL